ncbi:MAG: hypothetical protein WC998_03645 [Candidatus Paceibacterota bacterium]|jgi:hypothetical protein
MNITIYKDSINGFNVFKNNIILFLSISLISAIISFYGIPSFVKGNITEQAINQELNTMGYGGMMVFSTDQIIESMIYSTQFLVVLTVLFIIGYIVKHIIDKRLFNFKRWRDWKFFLYISAITFLEIYILGNVFFSVSTSFIGSIAMMVLYSFITVISSAILLPQEIKF